jgi:hypothetical protein
VGEAGELAGRVAVVADGAAVTRFGRTDTFAGRLRGASPLDPSPLDPTPLEGSPFDSSPVEPSPVNVVGSLW